MKYLHQYVYISNSDLVIDPCAENKHIITHIKNLMCASLFYNSFILSDAHPSIQLLDFSTVDFNKFDKTELSGLWYDKVHIVGIPSEDIAPYLIQKCCEFADSISFILPNGTNKYFTKEYHLLFSMELPSLARSSCIKDRKVFQIWLKGASPL